MKLKRIIQRCAGVGFIILINVLFCIGQEDTTKQPDLIDLLEMDIKDIMIISGEEGGFARQLERMNIKPYIHGYTAFMFRQGDLNKQNDNTIFDMHYFNPMIGVDVSDKVSAELMMEFEHGGEEINMRYGFVDYKMWHFLTLRAGKFLMPIGKFNEYLYPEHINIFVDRPLTHYCILPVVWGEVGAQLRGNYEFTKKTSVSYAVYVVNGLEQSDGGYGGGIRAMRNNYRDMNNDDKAFGGRISLLPVPNAEIGISYYNGAYTHDGRYRLSMLVGDAEYKTGNFAIRGEYVFAQQDTASGTIKLEGFFAETSYKIREVVEPTIRYEQASLPTVSGFMGHPVTEQIQRITAGLIIYPEFKVFKRFNFKVNYSFILNDGNGNYRNEFIVQTALGF